MFNLNRIRTDLLSFCNVSLEKLGVNTPINELVKQPRFYILALILLFLTAETSSFAALWSIRAHIADNILAGTGLASYLNPLHFVKGYIYLAIFGFIMYRLVRHYMDELMYPIIACKKYFTRVEPGDGIVKRSLNQILEYPAAFGALVIQFQKIENRTDLISSMTILGSLLKLPQSLFESILGKIPSMRPIQGEEQMLSDVAMMMAVGLTVTKAEIGDVQVDNFIVKFDQNQRAIDNIFKRIQPLLVRLGLSSDSNYDSILEIAEEIKSLSTEDEWMKVTLKTCPNSFLTSENSARITALRSKVDRLKNKLNTLTTRELRSDRVVIECQKIISSLETLFIEVSVLETANTTRVKPVGVCIQGEKQIGKTNLVDILTRKVCKYVEVHGGLSFRKATNWNTWAIQSRDEFDTGYTGQEITYDDDAFQQKDNKDHQRWFTFISNSPVGTNQADLKQKGLLYKSKLVFTTCNKMPIKSVTIEDIEALHARFPHTICMKRNGKPMPKSGERVESYEWVDMLYGPMSTAVSDMSANKPVRGAAKTGSLVKLSLDEIVKRIGDDLILQDKYYNSCLQREQLSGVSGQEQGLREFYSEVDATKFDPMHARLSWMISSMAECGTIRPAGGIKPVDQKGIIDYVKNNIMSFRAYNVIKSMQITGPSFEKWLESYIKCMVRGYTSNLADLEHIYVANLSGLQLKCARALAREHKLVQVVEPGGSDDYKTCLDEVAEYINHEVEILDTDIISLALTKLALFELPPVFKESTWKDVLPWVMGLENTTTGMNFIDHVDNYPMALSDFLPTLHDWRVRDEQLFESFYAQPVLFIKQDGELYAWSPAIERGERFVRVNYEFRKLREELKNYLSFDCSRITDFGWQDGQIYEGLPQEGYPCDINSHLKWLKMLQDSPCRVHRLDQLDRMQYLWKKVKTRPSPVTTEQRSFLNSLQRKVPPSSFSKEVIAEISASVKDKYQQLDNYYSRLTKNGMGSLLAILSRLGVPVSEYWNNLLIDNAPIITSTVVSTIIALVFLSLVKIFKYGIEGEQQSKGEKRAKQKKIVPRKFNKLQLITGKQQSNNKMLERFDTADLGLKNQPDMAKIEDLFEHISEYPNLCLVGMSYNKGTSEEANFANIYAAFDEEYDFSYDTPQQPSWKKVTSYREDGERIIEFNVRGQGTEAEVMDVFSHMLETAKYYPAGAWTLESNFKLEDDQILYSIRLFLLNAKSRGGTVSWTRADVSKILDVQNMLNGGKIINIDSVVTGLQQSAPQAFDSLSAVVRNHLVKVECVKITDVGNPIRLGRRVHALGSRKFLILPAHAVEGGYRWVRFSRVGDSQYVGLAIVECLPDYVRDIAVARIISRYEGEELLSNSDHAQALRNISMQEFIFPDITKYLLTAEQAEVDWDGCSTLHYFANRKVVALGSTESFLVQSFQVPASTESGETMTMKERRALCCKQALQSNFPLSELGDCGSPVVLATGKCAGKLISFHTYYSPKTQQWFSAVITKEDLGVVNGLQQSFEDGWGQLIVPGTGVDLPHGPEVKYIGDLVRPSLPVTKSSLEHWRKSPFADQFEEQLAPGRLDPYDPYIEIELPVNKEGRKSLVLGPNSEMAKELPELDQNLLDWCKTQLVDEQVALFKSEQSLTRVSDDIDEMLDYALNGKPENKYVRGMEINKASGLPWSLNGTAKKSDFIELDDQTGVRSFRDDKNGKALKTRVTQKLMQAKTGRRMISFSSSKLKDQPIKIAQAKSGRTRVFHCIPVDLILFQAALYGPYKEAYTRAGLKAYHAVGIDPKSVGWMELAAYMTKHPNYFDADYKNYDKYLHRQVYKCVRRIQREVIQRVCPDGWDAARVVEELDAIDTYVVDYRTIYQTNRANKSGSYTTTIDNCLANDIYGLYAWVKSTGIKSLYEYRANVSSVAFGDDIIKSVSDVYADKYNYCTYRDVLNATGHIITPGSKDGEEKPFTSFENLQFLKRGFKMERGMVLAPLLKRSIEGPFVWTDIRTDQTTIWVNLVQEQLIEAALWGEEYYDEFRDKLKSGKDRRLNEALINLLNTSWEVTFQKFAERYYGA